MIRRRILDPLLALLGLLALVPMLCWALLADDSGGGDDDDGDDDSDDDDGGDDDQGDDDGDDEPTVEELKAENKRLLNALKRAKERAKKPRPDPTAGKDGDGKDGDADNAGAKALERANTKILHAAARADLVAAGVPAKAAKRAVRLLDLDDVTVDDDGEVDEDELADAIEQLREEMPELFGGGKDDDDADDGKRRRAGKTNTGRGEGKAPAKTWAHELLENAGVPRRR